MEKINCQARYVVLTSYTKISKGIGFTNHAACQPVTPENIRECLSQRNEILPTLCSVKRREQLQHEAKNYLFFLFGQEAHARIRHQPLATKEVNLFQ